MTWYQFITRDYAYCSLQVGMSTNFEGYSSRLWFLRNRILECQVQG